MFGEPAVANRKKKVVGALLLLCLFGAVFAVTWQMYKPATKPKPGPYGAIAMSSDARYGTAWGYKDPDSARQRSIAECARSGGQDCAVKIALNNTCGSLVTSGERQASYLVSDHDKVQAAAFGLAQCQAAGASDCAVREQFCGNGG